MIDWSTATVESCLESLSFRKISKVLARDYKPSGSYPIIDQGQNLIAGWTDDDSVLISTDLPIVIFGDHTRVFKYIDFPFVKGADGTQLLKPKAGIEPLFFYYACRAINLPSRGYNRHFKALKEKDIPIPPIGEQRNIARTLRRIDDAISLQDKQLQVATDMKRTAMQMLFTRGLKDEPQKETEIGPMPESWELRPIGEFAHQLQYGLSVRGKPAGRYPILRMNCQQDGKVLLRDLQFVNVDKKTAKTYRVKPGDILFNRTNSYELVGRTAIVEIETNAVFASYLVRVSVDNKRLDPRFLNHFLNWDSAQAELKKLASRGVSQANISAGKLREFGIPLTDLDEQGEIVAILDAIDKKIDLHRKKRAVLDDLFKALLHKLMTGDIRVGNLDLSALVQ